MKVNCKFLKSVSVKQTDLLIHSELINVFNIWININICYLKIHVNTVPKGAGFFNFVFHKMAKCAFHSDYFEKLISYSKELILLNQLH